MKARRKSDGEIIEVEVAVYNMKNGEPYYKCLSDGHHYPTSELDFNVEADTVIQGWVARDANYQRLTIYEEKPERLSDMWYALNSDIVALSPTLFPDLTWDSDPIEVEIIIKRKKK